VLFRSTVAPVGTQTGAGTIVTPDQGLFTELAGSAPYTINLSDPRLSAGQPQIFYNNTAGLVTLQTPIGVINGPASNSSVTYITNPKSVTTLTSTGANYIVTSAANNQFINVDVSTSITAIASQLLWINTTSAAITVTLPASPAKGDTIRIIDIANTFDTNNLTIGRNGRPIMGASEDMTVSTEGAAFDLIFYDVTQGWRVFTI
jgi:hypothetical protein